MTENYNICSISIPNKTAILFFSRSASAEASYKRFGLSYRDAVRANYSLQRKIYTTLSNSPFVIVKCDESAQIGANYGERLTNAIRQVWAKGYLNCIIVGGDVPDLSLSDLHQAQSTLNTGKSILGKDQRGGVFLIGIQKSSFRENEFAVLPWQTNKLAEALANTLANWDNVDPSDCPFVAKLDAKVDCNEAIDLIAITCNIMLLDLLIRRKKKLKRRKKLLHAKVTSIDYGSIFPRRGPPVELLRAA